MYRNSHIQIITGYFIRKRELTLLKYFDSEARIESLGQVTEGLGSSILFFKIDFELPGYSSWIILIKYLTLFQENKLDFLDENLLENCIFKPIFFSKYSTEQHDCLPRTGAAVMEAISKLLWGGEGILVA